MFIWAKTMERIRCFQRKQHFVIVLTVTLVSLLPKRNIWALQRSRVWWQDIVQGTFTDEQWKEWVSIYTKLFHKLQRSLVVLEALFVEHRVGVTTHFLASTAEYTHSHYCPQRSSRRLCQQKWIVYSTILHAVYDHRYRFTDICIGRPGSVQDARVFANSQLMAQAVNMNWLPSSPEWTQAVQ